MPDGHHQLKPGDWWACEHPERPANGACHFHHACSACRLAFAVTALMYPWVEVGPDNSLGLSAGRHDALQVAVMLAEMFEDEAMARVVA